ncbi:MAG: hypothetical protein KC501_32245 [Myxococcales bacterium]|nr:hypothetical protein [Myxococcales bacterium]
MRGSALAAALVDQGIEARVLVPAERVGVAVALGAPHLAVERPAGAEALRETIEAHLLEHEARWLVLDTFAEGLYDELDGLRSSVGRIALLRCRRDAHEPRLARGLARCAHAVDLEPHLSWCPAAMEVEPFGPVTRALGSEPAEAEVLVVGTEGPLQGFGRRLAERLAAHGCRVARVDAEGLHGLGPTRPAFPLSASVLRARVVVGPAGFNLSYEIRALGGWHLALPRARPYDDQARRARALAETASSPAAVERKVLQLLRAPPPADRSPRVRAMSELADLLARCMGSRDHRQ